MRNCRYNIASLPKRNIVLLSQEENKILSRLNFEFNQLKGFFIIYSKHKIDWNISDEQISLLEDQMAEIEVVLTYFCMQIFKKHEIFFSLEENAMDFDLDLNQLFTYTIGELKNVKQ